jgi:murein DD-endopeptidase MepM/ murein hydrolase activator NlpD
MPTDLSQPSPLTRRLSLPALLLLLAGLAAHLDGPPVQAQSRRDLERRRANVRARRAEAEKRLRQLKVAESSAAKDLYLAQDRLARAEDQYLQARAKLVRTQKTLRKVKTNYEEMERRFGQHREAFRNRLVALYERGESSFLEAVLEAQSFAELAERGGRCATVLNRDQLTLQRVQAEKERLAAAKATYEQQMREEQKARTEKQEIYERVKRERAEAHGQLAKLRANKARWEDTYKELERASREIEAHLRQLAAGRTAGGTYSGTWGGSFLRPVGGRITSRYGYRSDPFTGRRRRHTGVDLDTGRGTPVKAADAGKVIHAGWWGAYGKCLIIDHGKGASGDRYTTLYAHLLSYRASRGTIVKRGQVIALADSTGRSTGHHLHFEVRKNGRPINPLSAVR